MEVKSKLAIGLGALGLVLYLCAQRPTTDGVGNFESEKVNRPKSNASAKAGATATRAVLIPGALANAENDSSQETGNQLLTSAARRTGARSIAAVEIHTGKSADEATADHLQDSEMFFSIMELTTEFADNISTEKTDDEFKDSLRLTLQRSFAADANVMALASANSVELSRSAGDFVGSKEPDGCVARFGQCGKHPEYTGLKLRIPEAANSQACLARADDFAAFCENAGAINLSFYQDGHLADSRTTVPKYISVE